MNKKGMTLIEMITTISILSIIGLMIFTGFSAVIRMMNKSSEYKNISDILNAYAEDRTPVSDIDIKQDEFKYTITSNTLRNSVDTDILSLKRNSNADVGLRTFEKPNIVYVKNSEAYKTLFKNVSDMLNTLQTTIVADSFDKNVSYNTSLFFNTKHIWDISNTKYKYPKFPKELLPKAMQSKVTVLGYSIKIYFPWDYMTTSGKYRHDFNLVYLSNNSENPKTGGSEIINMVYDYDHRHWYYNENSTYSIHYLENPSKPTFVGTKADGSEFTSYASFINYIKKSGSGWKRLNINMEYTSSNPDLFWLNT